MLLDEENLELAVQNTANLPDGLKLLAHFISSSGCYTQGLSKDERTELYNKGQRDFGLKIRDLLLEYAPNKYIELIKEGAKENERSRQH